MAPSSGSGKVEETVPQALSLSVFLPGGRALLSSCQKCIEDGDPFYSSDTERREDRCGTDYKRKAEKTRGK